MKKFIIFTFMLLMLSGFSLRQPLSIPDIVRNVADSVVEIDTQNVVRSHIRAIIQPGAGSGVIFSSDGYIITNNHVIVGTDGTLVDNITVRLRNGDEFEATIVGRDERTDLAIIKIEAENLTTARFGDSANLLVGELAVAIGNPLGNLGGTVTEGIISALNRDIVIDGEEMNLLQTSAAVNPGNSGGGLFNRYGELIGIVNAKPIGHGIEGIGFAIPSNQVKIISSQLKEHGVVLGRVAFDVDLVDINDSFAALLTGAGALGLHVSRDHEESGLRVGDRIIQIAGVSVRNYAQARAVYLNYDVGDQLEVVFVRARQNYRTYVTLVQAEA